MKIHGNLIGVLIIALLIAQLFVYDSLRSEVYKSEMRIRNHLLKLQVELANTHGTTVHIPAGYYNIDGETWPETNRTNQ